MHKIHTGPKYIMPKTLTKEDINPKLHIPDEVFDWLRGLLLTNTGFKTCDSLSYYVEQNVRGHLLTKITEKYNER